MRIAFRIGLRIAATVLLVLLLGTLLAGEGIGSGVLHPGRRVLTPELVTIAGERLEQAGGHRENFEVTAPDGFQLRSDGHTRAIYAAAIGPKECGSCPALATRSRWAARLKSLNAA